MIRPVGTKEIPFQQRDWKPQCRVGAETQATTLGELPQVPGEKWASKGQQLHTQRYPENPLGCLPV